MLSNVCGVVNMIHVCIIDGYNRGCMVLVTPPLKLCWCYTVITKTLRKVVGMACQKVCKQGRDEA